MIEEDFTDCVQALICGSPAERVKADHALTDMFNEYRRLRENQIKSARHPRMIGERVPLACTACGGTGDQFDFERDDWALPRRNCYMCSGAGEVLVCRHRTQRGMHDCERSALGWYGTRCIDCGQVVSCKHEQRSGVQR